MGQIIIELPQKMNRKYRIVSESSAKEVSAKVEKLLKKENKSTAKKFWDIGRKEAKRSKK